MMKYTIKVEMISGECFSMISKGMPVFLETVIQLVDAEQDGKYLYIPYERVRLVWVLDYGDKQS
jgi:hypothetical protein